jgi:2-polyprenyl-3-methyl-5-hydroxy-6-metoxy-1,4-benzoquinol methylase
VSEKQPNVPVDPAARFAFGANWARFLSDLSEERIAAAEASLVEMLGKESLKGLTFLDVGSGSGLFSLAARRLGASVRSFDFDQQSVNCTVELRRRYFPNDPDWTVDRASALDQEFMNSLGKYDVVYSWGVLHHTGAMWLGIELAAKRVRDDGLLYLAIYNDQGWWSRVWWLIKFVYLRVPALLKPTYAYALWYAIVWLNVVKYTLLLRPMVALRPLLSEKPRRGMSQKHDIVDWMGGFPFEFVRYDVLVAYLQALNFKVVRGNANHGIGCHEVVLKRAIEVSVA